MAETQGAPSLRELSEAATKGEWHVDWLPAWNEDNGAEEPPICDGICIHTPEHEAENVLCCAEPEAAFIVALVNAFRAGRLIDPTTLTEAVAAARAEGVREGLERAATRLEARADYFGSSPGYRNWDDAARSYRASAEEIRALIPTPPTTPGGRTDG